MSKKSLYGLGRQVLQTSSMIALIAGLAACAAEDPPASSSSGTTSSGNTSSSGTTSSGNTSSSGTTSSGNTSSSGTTSSGNTSSGSSSSGSTSSSSGSITVDTTSNGQFRVKNGKINDGNSVVDVQCGNWFGLEGQHEPKDAENNADGAPLELYIGSMWWHDDANSRDIQQTMDEIKELGINFIRLPLTPQTLDPNDEQGIGDVPNAPGGVANGVLKSGGGQANAREAMEDFIKLADQNDLYVLLDIHSCSNFVGWRAGRLDAAPPYADSDRLDYDFGREDYACDGSGSGEYQSGWSYNKSKWLDDLRDLAGLSDDLNVDNIVGIDIFNEPWEYTWDEWAELSEDAYDAINAVNPDILVFIEGVGSKAGINENDEEVPHGDDYTNPNWGENMYGYSDRPLDIPQDQLVLSPHTYGPSVFVQSNFLEADCANAGKEGHGAGDDGCAFDLKSSVLEAGWEEHFGYLRDEGFAMVIGEFGGIMNWPEGTGENEQESWSHVSGTPDADWQNYFVDYMIKKDIEGCYWSINPESGDTGGIYTSAYDEDTNPDAWGQWGEMDSEKTALLKRLWAGN